MPFAKLSVLIVACLSLSGCFESERTFFTEQEGRQPLPSGRYEGPGHDPSFSVAKVGSNKYNVGAGTERYETIVVPSDRADEYFIQAESQLDLVYALLIVNGSSPTLIRPDCKSQAMQDIAKRFGAEVRSDGESTNCYFTDRQSLIRALRAIPKSAGVVLSYEPE